MRNDPKRDAVEEALWAAENGFDFLDLTIEGPAAALEQLDVPALKQVLGDAHMGVVGHTAWFLPFASPVERVRRAAVAEVAAALPVFAALGASAVTVHIVSGVTSFGRAATLRANGQSFAELAALAAPHSIQMVVEHPPDKSMDIDDIRKVLSADKRLGFHLDVGHANVGGDRLDGLLKAFGARQDTGAQYASAYLEDASRLLKPIFGVWNLRLHSEPGENFDGTPPRKMSGYFVRLDPDFHLAASSVAGAAGLLQLRRPLLTPRVYRRLGTLRRDGAGRRTQRAHPGDRAGRWMAAASAQCAFRSCS